MAPGSSASWLIEQEARALLTRLDRVRPFAINETMTPAAAPSPAVLSRIEQYLLVNRRELRRRVGAFLSWLHAGGRRASPADQQRRFTMIRLQFNTALSQFDLFAEVITQRSERENGVWLSGLDVLATDALHIEGVDAPPVICYLARGPGAAIRRARTRLPGGGQNPVAIIRVPRERMVGHGIASSLIHEVGHQAAALIGLVDSLRPELLKATKAARPDERPAWRCWSRWVSEVVADLWSVGHLGIGSTLGLLGVVSLPRWAVFRPSGDDPHPIPWIRVLLSCAMGETLYPHPQWAALARVWQRLYPLESVTGEHRRTLERLVATVPAFARLLARHRPVSLGGRAVADVLPLRERRPDQLLARYRRWERTPIASMSRVAPSLAFAVLGQARAAASLTPEAEARILSELLNVWALRSTLDISALCAERTVPVLRRVS
jgi:hypothetical protein